ncbi:MAG TPA: type II secretion system protein N [Allosphingosinicella sp.]
MATAFALSVAWLFAPSAPAPPSAAPIAEPAFPAPLSTPLAPAPAAPAVSADGLVLYGVSGASRSAAAIIGSRLGGQRVVPVGSDFRPGLKLAEVGVDYAILHSGGQGVRLELSRYASGGSARAAAALPAEEERKIESAVLRNILKPVMSGSRLGGYALRPGESLPQLIRAGLVPGDVIVSVNGSQLDEERLSELAWQMGNAAKTEFVFMRNGRKMRASV